MTNPYVNDLLSELANNELNLGPCACAAGELAADTLLLAFIRAGAEKVLHPEEVDEILGGTDRTHAVRHARWKLARSEHDAYGIVWVPDEGHYLMTNDPDELARYAFYRTRVHIAMDLPMIAAMARARSSMDGRTSEARSFSDFLDRRTFTMREDLRAARDLIVP